MLSILLTFEVLKFDKFNELKLLQPQNIKPISVTSEVSKLEKSISIILEHPLNI